MASDVAVERAVVVRLFGERGYRTLVVDLDPQAFASLWLGRGGEPGLYRAIAEKRDLEPFVRAAAVAGLDIVAWSRELAAVDDLRGRIGIRTALKCALQRKQHTSVGCWARG